MNGTLSTMPFILLPFGAAVSIGLAWQTPWLFIVLSGYSVAKNSQLVHNVHRLSPSFIWAEPVRYALKPTLAPFEVDSDGFFLGDRGKR